MINPKRKKPHFDRKRAKKRYFLIEFFFKDKKDSELFSKTKEIYHDISNFIDEYWGLMGKACFKQIKIKHFNPLTKIAIISVPFAMEKMFKEMVPHINMINKVPCTTKILHISGTILQIQKRILEYNREIVRMGGKEIINQENLEKLEGN